MKGLIYSNIVPRCSTLNVAYIMKALATVMKHLKKKRPQMVEREWWFSLGQCPSPHCHFCEELAGCQRHADGRSHSLLT